jgi:kanamycin kinase
MAAGLTRPPMPVAAAARAGQRTRVVWKNRHGGRTWEVGADAGRRFVKWAPAGSVEDLAAEAARMRWARPYTPVPELIEQGRDDAGTWLVTAALPGSSAVTRRWKAEPATAVRAIGEGLRAMHESLPAATCPFSFTAADQLALLRGQVEAGLIDRRWWPSHGRPLTTDRALDLLADVPPDDLLVVCHGDTCSPNTLVGADGRWSGHVDLGDLGIADRWADLAIATWSAGLNYGPGWEGPLLDAYGIKPDHDRIGYYRLLGRCGDGPGRISLALERLRLRRVT